MGSATLAVGVSGMLSPVAITETEQTEDVVRPCGLVDGQTRDGGVGPILSNIQLG